MAAVAGYYEEAQGEQQGDESMEVRTNCDLIDGGIADIERGGPGNILVCLVIRLDNKSLPVVWSYCTGNLCCLYGIELRGSLGFEKFVGDCTVHFLLYSFFIGRPDYIVACLLFVRYNSSVNWNRTSSSDCLPRSPSPTKASKSYKNTGWQSTISRN